MNKDVIDFSKVDRVEVVDETGRAYVKWDIVDVQPSLQDDGRTLKLFLSVQPSDGDVCESCQ
jgi:hypothetical protein